MKRSTKTVERGDEDSASPEIGCRIDVAGIATNYHEAGDGPPVLLKNVNPDHHHWVELKLIGGPKSPRDAVGATVYLTASGMRQREDVMSGGSYISSNDQRPHFGLGDATDPGSAEIHWGSGAKETIKLPAVDRIYTVREGAGIVDALCGGRRCPDRTK